jgi:hypothetical protein
VAEELRLNEGGGQNRTIEGHQIGLPPPGQIVQALGGELLPGPPLAHDEDGAIHRGRTGEMLLKREKTIRLPQGLLNWPRSYCSVHNVLLFTKFYLFLPLISSIIISPKPQPTDYIAFFVLARPLLIPVSTVNFIYQGGRNGHLFTL